MGVGQISWSSTKQRSQGAKSNSRDTPNLPCCISHGEKNTGLGIGNSPFGKKTGRDAKRAGEASLDIWGAEVVQVAVP